VNLKYKVQPLSEQAYLDGELVSDIRRELVNGAVYAMAGASTNHNRLVSSIVRELGVHLKNTLCEPFASDMKVQVGKDFFYPDALVVCDHEANDYGITDTPLIIVEVLSKSTRRIDHTLKRTAYQQVPSLQEYVVIEQDVVDVEVCRRKNHWQSEHFYLGDEVFFESIDYRVPVADIYDRVVNSDMNDYLKSLEADDA